MALADALAFESPRKTLIATALVVDHDLQDGSAARADRVRELLMAMPLDAETVRVRTDGQGGPEAAARDARYAALDAFAVSHHARAVFLGHTRDDQAETVLLGLARGSGSRSLSGMRRVNGLYRRPLLAVGRATTRAACEARGLEVWDDPQNAERRFTRVRVRHEVLPMLEETMGPGVADALSRTADLVRDDADALDAIAEVLATDVISAEGSEISLSVDELLDAPAALRRRVLLRAAALAGCPGGSLSARHAETLDAFLTSWHGQGAAALPGGVVGTRSCGRLRLSRTAAGSAGSSAKAEE
jgi:tRNA(Ile)-lysidine synthase